MSFHVEVIPNRNSPPTVLLRQAWRDGKRIRRRTIANLTKLPPALVDRIRTVVKGGIAFSSLDAAVSIRRAWPHGHVAAVLGLCRQLGIERLLHRHPGRVRDLALAAIVARVLAPDSRLATARRLSPETADSSLGPLLGLGPVSGNEMLDMLDWLLERQPWIERSLANRHLQGGALILYDVTSSYLEGRCCPLAAFGHNRDGKSGKMQIVFGLLCASDGCPVAVELFAGNTGDPRTLEAQVRKVRLRSGIEQIAFVGDRGMITTARIRQDLEPAGLAWISALKTTDIRKLLQTPPDEKTPPLVPSSLLPDTVAEILSDEFPGERLMVCLNPRLRENRARKREQLLSATERILEDIAAAVRRPGSRLRGRDRINRRVGRDANRKKVAKHFHITVTDTDIVWTRNQAKIDAEAQYDGIYVIRTSLDADAIGAQEAVAAYKSLARVERAFRSFKTQLEVRPVFVYTADHVRAHVFLCMLAYYLQWHLRRRLAPLLFEDHDRPAAHRKSPVEKAQVSQSALRKASTRHTPDGLPVHSLRTLLDDLATLTLNQVTLPGKPDAAFPLVADPTPLHRKAFELLEIDPAKTVSSKLTG